MSKAITLDGSFVVNGDVDLPTKFDGISEHNMYLYIKSYLSRLRTNAANVKTRAAVSGGGKKPWNQKGGGRARAGSITSPVFVGGGVAHGPSGNRNYDVRINKKQKILALEYALKHKADASKLYVVDRIVVDSGKTRDALSIFNNLRERDALFVVKSYDERTFLAFRNIRSCCLVDTGGFNAYLVAVFRSVVMERAVFDEIVERG